MTTFPGRVSDTTLTGTGCTDSDMEISPHWTDVRASAGSWACGECPLAAPSCGGQLTLGSHEPCYHHERLALKRLMVVGRFFKTAVPDADSGPPKGTTESLFQKAVAALFRTCRCCALLRRPTRWEFVATDFWDRLFFSGAALPATTSCYVASPWPAYRTIPATAAVGTARSPGR